MDKQKIQEGNILIAELIGGTCSNYADGSKGWIIPNLTKNGVDGDERNLKFHSSWDWFVPAFNKIQKMKLDIEYCDLILAWIRRDDHENAFKTLVNYINIVVYNKPIEINMKALKEHLKKN